MHDESLKQRNLLAPQTLMNTYDMAIIPYHVNLYKDSHIKKLLAIYQQCLWLCVIWYKNDHVITVSSTSFCCIIRHLLDPSSHIILANIIAS